MGTLHGEMVQHDRQLNLFFHNVKKDTLDETMSIQPLQKSLQYFKHVYEVHLSQVGADCREKMRNHCSEPSCHPLHPDQHHQTQVLCSGRPGDLRYFGFTEGCVHTHLRYTAAQQESQEKNTRFIYH